MSSRSTSWWCHRLQSNAAVGGRIGSCSCAKYCRRFKPALSPKITAEADGAAAVGIKNTKTGVIHEIGGEVGGSLSSKVTFTGERHLVERGLMPRGREESGAYACPTSPST